MQNDQPVNVENMLNKFLGVKEIAQMQTLRCFVESSFPESSSDIGMSEYQVRSWKL